MTGETTMTDETLGASIREALLEIEDPEVGLNILDMGLVYDVRCNAESGVVEVLMTLTTPSCPAGEMIVDGVNRRLSRVDGVTQVLVDLTFDPPWTPESISDDGRAQLGW